tara:strand:- start:108 stop:599 length:492 start_codon:yes stop_codon:yes gene_type:complete
MTDAQKAAREAAQVGEAERNADSTLFGGTVKPGSPPDMDTQRTEAMDTAVELDQQQSDTQSVPPINAKQADFDPDSRGVTGPPEMDVDTGDVMDTQRTENAEFLTRDREGMEDFPSMGREELQEARNRLMAQLRNEGPGTQRDAFVVLLNRIERALGKSGGEE